MLNYIANPGTRLWRMMMLAVTTCLLAAQPASGQIGYDFSAGPNLTMMNVDLQDLETLQEFDYDAQLGFYASLGVGMDLGPVSVHSGVIFVNAGGIFNGTDFLERDNFDVNFLTRPLDLRISIPISSSIQPYILGGGERRYRLDLSEDDISFEDNLKRQSSAASIGAGVRFSLPMLGVSVSPEVRYAIDLDGLTEGDVRIQDELVRIRDEFKANMLRFGLVFGL